MTTRDSIQERGADTAPRRQRARRTRRGRPARRTRRGRRPHPAWPLWLAMALCAAAQGSLADVRRGALPQGDARAESIPLGSAEALARALDDHLLASLPGRTLRWEMARPGPLPDRAGRRFRLDPPAVLTGGRNWFELVALDPPGATYLVPIDIAWQDSAWVAARALPAGRALAPGDALRELCWHANASEALAPSDGVAGLRLAVPVAAGRPLLAHQLSQPPAVARGSRVQLVCRRPGLFVSTPAKALDEGWAGGEIRVQPVDSRHVCAALVRSADEVEVILP